MGVNLSAETGEGYHHIQECEPVSRQVSLERFRDYEIKEEMGSGAYGAVYRAYQPAIDREVAVKVIRPEHANQPEFVQRFEAESQMVARLEHPHIVPVHDYWRDATGAYLVMRLLGGGNLKDILRDGPLSPEAFLQLVDDICSALSAAHARGIIHRDLKPSNILFDVDGNAYLSDFGIAKNLEAEVKLTPTGAVLGTPDYISPEQIMGQALTPAADQYCLGIVLFEALTGRVPYPGEAIASLFHKHLTEPMPMLASVNPELPPDLDLVLQRATAKDAADRYPGMTMLARALRTGVAGPMATDRQPLAPEPALPSFLEESDRPERSRPLFVGREKELAWLAEKFESTLDGQGQLAFVAGDAGAGKSALLNAFAEQAARQIPELLVARGSCDAFTGSGDPYLPFRDILNMLTGDIESQWSAGTLSNQQARALWEALPLSTSVLLDDGSDLINTLLPGSALVSRITSALPADSPLLPRLRGQMTGNRGTRGDLEQAHLFEQVAAVLKNISRQRPLLLLLDDFQWADRGSANLLFHLGRRLGTSPILIMCAYRPEEVALGREDGKQHPLKKILDEFKRERGDIWLDLDKAQDAAFIDDYLDSENNQLDESFRSRLFGRTEGHPLFTVELLRDLKERGNLYQDEEGRWVVSPSLNWDSIPVRVEGVIEARIDRLEEELRDILTIAAVEGEDFTAQVIAGVQQLQERQLLKTLSGELDRRHRLIREKAEQKLGPYLLSRYQFAHSLFQQYLYNDIGVGERRLIHREIASILEELHGERLEEITVQLAWHYTEAGDGDKALPYILRAGDNARSLYAFDEAIQHYERALAIYKGQGEYEHASRILMKLGLTYHSAFDYERSRQAYEESFTLQKRSTTKVNNVHLAPAPHALRVTNLETKLILDPGKHNDRPISRIQGNLFSGLVYLTPDMNIVPDIAGSWDVLDSGQTYVFHLRDDVYWTDGAPVTAHDFVLGWRRVLDPVNGSPAAPNLYDVRGAANYHQGDTTGLERLGVKALDNWTLRIDLEQPSSYFLYILNNPETFPVPGHIIASHGDDWTDLKNFVSNGPFCLQSYEEGRLIELRRNPTYHGNFGGNLESVHIRIMNSTNEVRKLVPEYEQDEFDILPLHALPTAERYPIIQKHAAEYVITPLLSTIFVSFDVSRPPFDDPRIRQAFVLATDRQTLAAVSEGGFMSPASGGFIPLGMPGHVPGIALPYDLAEARRLLAQAGYPGEKGFPKVTALTFKMGARWLEVIVESWLSSLGIECSFETMDWSAFIERISLRADLPHIYCFAWGADYPDPDNFMRLGVEIATIWRKEEYDALVDKARRIMDHEERMALYRNAEGNLVREAPFFPIYYNRDLWLVKPWIRNHRPELIGAPAWKDIIIDPH